MLVLSTLRILFDIDILSNNVRNKMKTVQRAYLLLLVLPRLVFHLERANDCTKPSGTGKSSNSLPSFYYTCT